MTCEVVSGDGLITHLEAFLGPIAGGWIEDANGDRLPFQVVWLEDAPEKDLATYSTLGLSRHAIEAGLIGSRGSKWFEDQLVQQQPALFDLTRQEIAH